MPTSLLQTKLHLPPDRPDLVARERLLLRLDEGLQPGRRLVLICTPAGYGKTSLLGAWAAPRARHVAWLSLDETDGDPARFWTYVVAALRTLEGAAPSLGQSVILSLTSSQPASAPSYLTDLLNELASVPGPAVLVLDDYHCIGSSAIHEGVAFLMDHLPPHVHLIIATRTDPPLPLARLRARGQLVTLRAGDLRFKLDEIGEFVSHRAGVRMQPADLSVLEERTEGWAAGLQMAALCLAEPGMDDITGFVRAFGGSNRYVLDYLLEEVLERQPPDVQTFLLQTSILERLCGPLCDAVLDTADRNHASVDAQQTLDYIDHANLFLTPLDAEGKWYRYHALFADLLRARLRQGQPGLVARLHARAAAWFEANGLVDEAIRHAMAAHDYDCAIRVMESHFWEWLGSGNGPTVLGWTSLLPEATVRSRPWLCVARAFALLFARHPVDATSWLNSAEAHAPAGSAEGNDLTLRAYITTAGVLAASMQGDYARSVELARRADALLAEDDVLKTIIPYTVGHACLAEGDLTGADRAFTRLVRLSRAFGNLMNMAMALGELATVRRLQGRLREAAALYREILQLAEQQGLRQSWLVANAELGLGELWIEWNDLPQARRWVEAGTARLRDTIQAEDQATAQMAWAQLLEAEGDLDAAFAAVTEAVRVQQAAPLSTVRNLAIDRCQVRLWLARGQVTAAAAWAEERRARAAASYLQREGDRLQRARVLARTGIVRADRRQVEEAIALLRQLEVEARAGGRIRSLIEILILAAVAWQATGAEPHGQEALLEALALAEAEGCVRIFAQEGPAVRALILRWRVTVAKETEATNPDTPRLLDYTDRLLAALPQPAADPLEDAPKPEPPGLVEPLTEREREILQMIAAGLSTQAIARKLIVAPGTVKAHLASIYRKLDVHSRTQALASARALRLLDD